MASEQLPPLQIHLEPETAIELGDLNSALSAVARQYRKFALKEGYATASSEAKLLVSSVKPGSIDIGLLPTIFGEITPEQAATTAAAVGGTAVAALTKGKEIVSAATGFATSLKYLLNTFSSREKISKDEDIEKNASIADCNDAIAIAAPIANSGGTQSFNVHNGDVYNPILVVNSDEAQRVVAQARKMKAVLRHPEQERRQRVPLQWESLPKSEPKTDGARSPDKGIIEEIDPRPRPIFFADEFTELKEAILGEHTENPYTRLYFVDVEVSRVKGKVASYRVTGYHGQEDMD